MPDVDVKRTYVHHTGKQTCSRNPSHPLDWSDRNEWMGGRCVPLGHGAVAFASFLGPRIPSATQSVMVPRLSVHPSRKMRQDWDSSKACDQTGTSGAGRKLALRQDET